MLLSIHPENPEVRKIKMVCEQIINDGLVVLPTDTIYGLMVRPGNKKGMDRIFRIKKMPKNHNMSILCTDLEMVSRYARNISNTMFKLMRRALPGPYTFIFNATKEVPKIMQSNKGTIGIRIPDNIILQQILKQCDSPLVSTSVLLGDHWYNDPNQIEEQIGKSVDIIVDGGVFRIEASTIINGIDGYPDIIREGKGPIDIL